MKALCPECKGAHGKHIKGVPKGKPNWEVCRNCNGRGWITERVVTTTALKARIRQNDTGGMIVIDPLEMYAKIAEWEGE